MSSLTKIHTSGFVFLLYIKTKILPSVYSTILVNFCSPEIGQISGQILTTKLALCMMNPFLKFYLIHTWLVLRLYLSLFFIPVMGEAIPTEQVLCSENWGGGVCFLIMVFYTQGSSLKVVSVLTRLPGEIGGMVSF